MKKQFMNQQGSARTVLLSLVFFCLGLFVSAFLLRQPTKPAPLAPAGPSLSDATKVVLGRINQPIELHFYSLLDAGAPASLQSFSVRVAQLLEACQQDSNGKLHLTRYDAQATVNPNVAIADGIKGFDLDKGDGCYLGLALSSNGKKEVLPQLSPEWESAFEADVSRAILRLSESSTAKLSATVSALDSALVDELKQKFPDLTAVSLEDGARALREASLKEFGNAVSQAQSQLQEAQTALLEAQKSGSAAAQDSAMKRLQAVQAAQTETLKKIAAHSQALIDALTKLKAGQN